MLVDLSHDVNLFAVSVDVVLGDYTSVELYFEWVVPFKQRKCVIYPVSVSLVVVDIYMSFISSVHEVFDEITKWHFHRFNHLVIWQLILC
jgi:hypothetical protein